MSVEISIMVILLCSAVTGLFTYLLCNKSNDKKDYKHESELKELELLFNERKKEFEDHIKKYDLYINNFQSYYHNLTEIIRSSEDKLRQIDLKGVYRENDQLGFFFKTLLEIQDILNGFDLERPLSGKPQVIDYNEDLTK